VARSTSTEWPVLYLNLSESAAVGWQAKYLHGEVLWTYAFPQYIIEYVIRISDFCCIMLHCVKYVYSLRSAENSACQLRTDLGTAE
jgi:hypothetical protein